MLLRAPASSTAIIINHVTRRGVAICLQVFQGRLDSLAVATIKALTTVMLKSPAAKVIRTRLLHAGSGGTQLLLQIDDCHPNRS